MSCNHDPQVKGGWTDAFYYDYPVYTAQVGCPLCNSALAPKAESGQKDVAISKAWGLYNNRLTQEKENK